MITLGDAYHLSPFCAKHVEVERAPSPRKSSNHFDDERIENSWARRHRRPQPYYRGCVIHGREGDDALTLCANDSCSAIHIQRLWPLRHGNACALNHARVSYNSLLIWFLDKRSASPTRLSRFTFVNRRTELLLSYNLEKSKYKRACVCIIIFLSYTYDFVDIDLMRDLFILFHIYRSLLYVSDSISTF